MDRIQLSDELKIFFKKKLKYFQIYSQISSQSKQFKTEKWLQAELLYYFRTRNINFWPEYSKKRWDLFLKDSDDSELFIAIKNYSDSLQNFSTDNKGFMIDVKNIKQEPNSIILLVLPMNRRQDYENRFLNQIRNDNELESELEQIYFESKLVGIQYLIIWHK